MRSRPAAPAPSQGELNLHVVRTEAKKVLWASLGEILSSAKNVCFIFMAAVLVLGVLCIQNRKAIRRLTERLAVVERIAQLSLK